MDVTTVIGIISGLVLIIVAILQRSGVAGLMRFVDLPSVFITAGGTFAATLVNYSFHTLVEVFGIVKKVFTQKEEDYLGVIETIVSLVKKARIAGPLAIEGDIKKIENPFLRHAFSLYLAGLDIDTIRDELETEITFLRERHKIGQEIFVTMGTFAPSFGMMGTVMGLIMMLANLEDQSQIATGMSVALLTTLYGVIMAYLIFLPIAGKLKRKSDDEVLLKEIIIEGIISAKKGDIPTIIEAKLKAYLPPKKRIRKVIEK